MALQPTLVLPRLMLVTDRHRMRPTFEIALKQALEAGTRFIQLREKDLGEAELQNLAVLALALCRDYDAIMLVNGPPEIAQQVGAAGTHWPESQLGSGDFTPTQYPKLLHGASVHSPSSAVAAEARGMGYLVRGSVFPTGSHPNSAPVGVEGLVAVTIAASLPIYAIGGITPDRVQACLAAGAHGIAVIGAVWDADDIGAAVRELLRSIAAFAPPSARTQD